MKPDPRAARRRAAVLVIFGAVLWWHYWVPGLLVVAFVAWVILHRRFQGSGRAGFMRFRARVWPPPTLVLVVLTLAGPAIYVLSQASIEAKVLPIALNAAALAVLVAGWTLPGAVPARSAATTAV